MKKAERLFSTAPLLVSNNRIVRFFPLTSYGGEIFAVKCPDRVETAPMWVAHLASARTVYSPGIVQLLSAVTVPTGSQPELLPSPHQKRY